MTTSGYIIADPASGSASYKVFSGSDGAKALLGLLGVVLLFLAIVVLIITGIAIIAAIIEGAIVAVLTAIGELVASYITAITIDDIISKCDAPTALQFILTFFAMLAAGQLMELPVVVDLIVDAIDNQWGVTDSTIENVCGKS